MSFRIMGHPSRPSWEDTDPAPDLVAELAYVALADRDYRASWPAQALPGYEVACVRDGALLLWTEGRCLRAGPGDVFVVPPRVSHREETPEESFSEALYLGAMFRSASGRACPFPLPIAPLLHLGSGNEVERRILRIAAEVQERAPGYVRIVSGAVQEIFWHLARATQGIGTGSGEAPPGAALPGSVAEVQEYLDRRHAEPLSIDDVARHFHLSRQYFSKLFRRATGRTPHAYLTEVRIRHARELLEQSRLSIQSIAERVGFSDPYYFARSFRQHTGLSPTQYRRQAHSEE